MEQTIFDKLLLISHLLQDDIARTLAGTPLTEARLGVLWVIQTMGPSTQQSIADALGVSARNISALVDALESTEYVQRTPHPTDRRAVLVELTETSTELMATMQRQHGEVATTLLNSVPVADRAAFERGLDAVVARLSELIAEQEAAAQADRGADQ
jgi:DNA-binding MarR family transcriptional regulator